MKNTPQRAVILDILKGRGKHLSAEEIYKKAREILPNISLGTVYRNLKILLQSNQVLDIYTGGISYYETNFFKEPHHHLICAACNKISDIDESIDVKARPNNFKVDYHVIFFYGRCKNCLGGKKK